ncbi:MAG: lysine--tRNA ligase [Candidatus Yanofskybacteria bacterium RIFCSPLOWO2_02_FULL_43_10b]|uniref:Lysine--tRNA ligase n=2 Tax=Candidatus Yanofskyibacteriota TaxID=1752733 RepID=A0A1F8H641_9BACT|nr:MAG: lysine--tRNA ligase [Candidatus Yanofskybacteria bacterium RIFCSPLOWO2_02_FULL_43_10b]
MSLEEIRKTKIGKLELLRKAGVNPYPEKSWRTHEIKQALENFDKFSADKDRLVLTGRVMAYREHGASAFLDLEDASGRIQLYFKKDVVGDFDFDLFLKTVDTGDILEASGFLMKTKKEERTLEVEKYRLLSKALLPLPEKWRGLQDVEERYRKRYLDFIFNPEVKKKIETRTAIVREIRQILDENNFLEVETPVLQTLAGGANAEPFETHLDTLNLDLYLRIAPELYLKRLLVGGFERVYEFAKNFRNEGMDRDHNPEFTMLEFYVAYWDYEKMMTFLEKMMEQVATKISSPHLETPFLSDFKRPYPRVTFNDLFKKYTGIDYDEADEETLVKKAKELEIKIEKTMTKGNVADEIYKKVARPKIVEPTFLIDHPLELSPLAKKIEKDPEHVSRFQLIAGGTEVMNGFSELNDPLDQRERFEEQEKIAKKGNKEAHRFDEDFVEALEYGMPPAAGVGIGIDRLAALLTDSHSVREIIAFPLMKPKDN